MRIALIHHQFMPRGGMERYLVEFAARLKMAGHELHAVCADMPEKIAEAIGATIHHVPVMRGSPLVRMWQFNNQAAIMVPELPVDVSIGFGRTTVQDLHRAGGGCHRIYSDILPPLKRWSLKNRLELALEQQLYTGDRTKKFIVNSSMVSRQLQDVYGVKPERIEVIHTAVDTARFKPAEDRAELRRRIVEALGSERSRPVFLFVSLSHKRKGLDVLLDMWDQVNADLWIVGKGLSFMQRRKVAKHGLGDRVHVLGQPKNIQVYYQAADWFIHPTLYDACANTVLQSMATGLPGLISVSDGATDFVNENENGLLLKAPRDPASVLGVVRGALVIDEATRAKMGAAAREAMMPLTWDTHLEQWMRVIDEVSPNRK